MMKTDLCKPGMVGEDKTKFTDMLYLLVRDYQTSCRSVVI